MKEQAEVQAKNCASTNQENSECSKQKIMLHVCSDWAGEVDSSCDRRMKAVEKGKHKQIQQLKQNLGKSWKQRKVGKLTMETYSLSFKIM